MNVQYSIYFKPHSILSGDFYWLGKKNEYFYLVVGDCTGHGIPASLLTVMGISLLNYIVLGKD
jgi:serine phosphatase RsbU (regulator of sigma subunit)